jgi:hypothetical protein
MLNCIQIFANEYAVPGNNVLIVCDKFINEIKEMFSFLNCNTFFINNNFNYGIDIVCDKYLPFDDYTFDLVINLKSIFSEFELIRVLKKSGHRLINFF